MRCRTTGVLHGLRQGVRACLRPAVRRSRGARVWGWALLLTLGASAPARADVYGFIDAQGVIHFAATQLDDRYTLFFKDGGAGLPQGPFSPRGPAGAPVAHTQPVAPQAAIETAPLPDLWQSRLFERLIEHPNLQKYDDLIQQVASEQGVDAALLKSVIAVESAYQPGAVSPKGAIGLMQVLPGTGERYGLRADPNRSLESKLTDPSINLRVGARYLADLKRMFSEDLDLVLAAYNAGENAVRRFRNSIPPFPETQAYVKLVRAFYRQFKPPEPAPPAPLPPPVVRQPVTPAAPGRLRMTIAGRRNVPDMVTLPSNEVLQVPSLPAPEALQVPSLPAVAAGAQLAPAVTAPGAAVGPQ